MMKRRVFVGLVIGLCAGAAQADIAGHFVEGAPKDRFVFTNTGACDLTDVAMILDLSPSAAGLIFDVTGEGAGVEVFQPFEFVAGAELVSGKPMVADGNSAVRLAVPRFPSGAEIAFTIDVDDTQPVSNLGQIRVSGDEIAGAELRVGGAVGVYDDRGRVTVPVTACNV